MRNAMSIDLEEWFHPEILRGRFQTSEWSDLEPRAPQIVDRLLQILAASDVRATFFVLGWVAERHPDIVPRLVSAGHEVASHGYVHAMITQQTPEEFEADLSRSLDILRRQSGQPVVGYRAPSFSVVRETLWAFDVMLQHGIEYDSSIYPVHHDRYGIPEAPRQPYRVARREEQELWELPPPTLRIGNKNLPVAGGGYLRLLPYTVTRFALRRLNATGIPGIVYTHPWEFDLSQPRVSLSLPKRLRHYTNVARNEGKLRRLLQEFEFTTCHEVLQTVRPVIHQPVPA
jgi:polysaccharide deacetylase family protein (PEP-CTERM system associated)